ncbi:MULTISPECIES: NADH-quinone oxidoreductase subunit NuoN [Inquilinus]|uniref:NADH-quinone oxidoreductase subunit N n=1 Tax=Inquilinus ginsengisoli TaxID=363840 RepID=A0ABU1JRS3_9PROT|nr:NADH-quinone oxidoreductase subunit N [Inquilinus ginsengisoli]
MVSLPDLMPALPEIFLACAGLALLLIGVFLGEKSTRIVAALAVMSFIITAALLVMGPQGRVLTFNGMFVTDGFAVFMKILVLVGSSLALILSLDYLEHENMSRFEFPVLFVLATLGMLLMVSANSLIALYLGLELQSLALYVVAAFNRDSERSSEAGLKYFVLGALSSGMLLYGASLVYGFTGTVAFDGLAQALPAGQLASMGVIIGIVFICAGLAFKVSAVPFHMWTPDVYEGAPTPVTAFFAVAPKVAAMALFVRVLVEPFGHLTSQWQQIIVVASALSMILGAFAAIAQTNVKRLMAYSSIGHVGFALLGLAAGTPDGITAVIVYLSIYVAMSIGTFAVILSMRVDGKAVEGIQDLAGLGKSNPGTAFALVIMMFSMAGIPPLAGFFAKLYVFRAVIAQGTTGFIILAVIGVVSSVVSAYYYLRVIRVMYFEDPKIAFDKPAGAALPSILAVATLFIVFFWILPAPLTGAAQAAAASLFGG